MNVWGRLDALKRLVALGIVFAISYLSITVLSVISLVAMVVFTLDVLFDAAGRPINLVGRDPIFVPFLLWNIDLLLLALLGDRPFRPLPWVGIEL